MPWLPPGGPDLGKWAAVLSLRQRYEVWNRYHLLHTLLSSRLRTSADETPSWCYKTKKYFRSGATSQTRSRSFIERKKSQNWWPRRISSKHSHPWLNLIPNLLVTRRAKTKSPKTTTAAGSHLACSKCWRPNKATVRRSRKCSRASLAKTPSVPVCSIAKTSWLRIWRRNLSFASYWKKTR